MQAVSPELLQRLAQIDTPTLCNAIEVLADQPFTVGYTGYGLRCLSTPRRLAGYAATVKLTTARPPRKASPPVSMAQYLDHLASVPTPRLAILCDVDDPPGRAAAFGDVMANYHRAMGCVAMVTNGAVRDLEGIEAAGVACYGAGLIPSHGYFHFLATGEPVCIAGLEIHQGDLLVGDEHGLVRVPPEIAAEIPAVCEQIRRREETLISYCRSPQFTPAGYADLTRVHPSIKKADR